MFVDIGLLPVWEYMLGGNRLLDYGVAAGIFLGFILIFKWIQWALLRSLDKVTRRTKTEFDDSMVEVVRTIRPPFYSFVGFYLALQYLEISGLAQRGVTIILLFWLVYQVISALQIFVEYYFRRRMTLTDDKSQESVIKLLRSLTSVILWTLGGLFILQNLGVNVTSLIAGLGIGGIAIGLAAQNVLGDLFSSLAIYLDKPFVPGDFIVVGNSKGTVQEVGIKTTRIKALSGEEIVMPNKELTEKLINNFGRMQERRILFKFGVVYETEQKKMRQIPEMVRAIIENQDLARFDRVHFKDFSDSSLDFEAVYHLASKEYGVYMDTHQAILLGIKEKFENEGIAMAYPTRTVYLNK